MYQPSQPPSQQRILDQSLKGLVDLGLAGRWVFCHPELAARMIKATLLDRVLVEPRPHYRGAASAKAMMRTRLRSLRQVRELTQVRLIDQANEILARCHARPIGAKAISEFENANQSRNLLFLEAVAICQVLDVPMSALSPWRFIPATPGFDANSPQQLERLRTHYAVDAENPSLDQLRQAAPTSSAWEADAMLGLRIKSLRSQAGYSRSDLLYLVNVQMAAIGAPNIRNESYNSGHMAEWGYEIETARRGRLSLMPGLAIAQTLSLEPEQLCPYLVERSRTKKLHPLDSPGCAANNLVSPTGES